MKLIDIYKETVAPIFSVEVMPPRNGSDEHGVFETIEELEDYNIGFISVTMGSDLSLRGGSLALAAMIKSRLNIEVLAHCTCVGRSREEIENLLTECRYLGLKNILALRGDPPLGKGRFSPHPRGHKYAFELVDQIVKINNGIYLSRITDQDYDKGSRPPYREGRRGGFCIGVAGHPDGHPECLGYEKNFLHLKQKQDAGAQFIITQAFFHIDIFKRFMEMADNHGITIPIVPGIMPITNYRNLTMVSEWFKVSIPERLRSLYEKSRNNPHEFRRIGIDKAVSLCNELMELNIKGIQFFSLNRKGVISEILSRIDPSIKSPRH